MLNLIPIQVGRQVLETTESHRQYFISCQRTYGLKQLQTKNNKTTEFLFDETPIFSSVPSNKLGTDKVYTKHRIRNSYIGIYFNISIADGIHSGSLGTCRCTQLHWRAKLGAFSIFSKIFMYSVSLMFLVTYLPMLPKF